MNVSNIQDEKMISVIMSVYNESENDLTLSIDSILNQTYKMFEFIIVLDNPNNYKLKRVLDKYSKKDKRIKIVINETNIGLAESLNKAFNHSNGKYIARMDADDISENNRFEKQMKAFGNEYQIVSSDKINIDENGNILETKHIIVNEKKYFKKILKCSNIIVHPSVIMKREVFQSLSGYRNFKAAQDYDFWLRAIKKDYNFYMLNEALINYRIREDSISNLDYSKQHGYMMYAKYLNKIEKGNNLFSSRNYESYLKRIHLFSEKDKKKYNDNYKILINKYPYFSKIKKVIFIIKLLFNNRTLLKYYIPSKIKDYYLIKYEKTIESRNNQ